MNGYDTSSRYHLLFWAIGFALIVKYFFVRRLTTLSPGKCLLADTTMNVVSTSLGIILIPAAAFLWQLSIGTILNNYLHIGTFDLGALITPYVTVAAIFLIAVFVLAWLETITLRFVFNQGDFGRESHWKFFRWLCVANAAVVGFAVVILFVHFTWAWHKNSMTPDFIGRCLDNAVFIGLGIAMIIVGLYRIRRKVRSGEYDEAKGKSQLKRAWLCGCLLIGFGVFQLFFSLKNTEQKYSWQRVSTTDGYASAEFPLLPTKEEKTYQDGTSSIHMITFNCNLHGKDVNLRLTYSQIPQKYESSTDNDRLEAVKANFQREGFTISTFTNENIGVIPVYRIVANENNGNGQATLLVAFQHDAIYRVVASSSRGFQTDPAIARFVDSFQIQ